MWHLASKEEHKGMIAIKTGVWEQRKYGMKKGSNNESIDGVD